MKISIGADHRGFKLKQAIVEHFGDVEWLDVGTHDEQRTDYPLYAQRVCKAISDGGAQAGILICGSGVGVSIAANRFKGIYAALCWNADVARLAKEHDGANVLVLPSDFVTSEQAFEMIKAWRDAVFKGGRYQERLEMMDKF